ncbi:MAG TPA: zf-HC2 domain-containing protein [Fimbriiglobus sp.]|nr:zf-HC2 domain-containing protein [Fimbriiglobus sp.]
MSCEELVGVLLDFVGGDLSPEQRAVIEQHLCGCPPCGQHVEEYRLTIRVTRLLPKADPLPPAFEARLRAALAAAERGE